MNIWLIAVQIAKFALFVILAFISIIGFSGNLTEVLNDILKKRDVRNDIIADMFIWGIVCFFALAFLFKFWFL